MLRVLLMALIVIVVMFIFCWIAYQIYKFIITTGRRWYEKIKNRPSLERRSVRRKCIRLFEKSLEKCDNIEKTGDVYIMRDSKNYDIYLDKSNSKIKIILPEIKMEEELTKIQIKRLSRLLDTKIQELNSTIERDKELLDHALQKIVKSEMSIEEIHEKIEEHRKNQKYF